MQPKLVYLEWFDAISNAAWFTAEEAKDWGESSDWTIKEAGWLIKQTPQYVVIATSWKPADDYTDEQFCNMHKIPKSWVRKMETLKTP